MKLADLLSELEPDDLERLAHEHARADEGMPRIHLLEAIASVLRSHRFLHDFLLNRQPPTFAILTLLLDAERHRFPAATFRQAVTAETSRICSAIDARDILARDDQLRVYRRVLYQARSNDRILDASETSLLGVLRQEMEIAPVEHFLLEHHSDFREFWAQDEGFLREMNALRSAGLVVNHDADVVVPSDLVKAIRRVLGLEMRTRSVRRLLGYLTNVELRDALSDAEMPMARTKEERVERLLNNAVSPRSILQSRKLERLRELAEAAGVSASGNKDALVERILVGMDNDQDVALAVVPAPPTPEPRLLDELRFRHMFSVFRGHELAAILGEYDLRRWGVKDTQIGALWQDHRSEQTFLSALSNSDLKAVLERLDLRTAGTKAERAMRLIEHFATAAIPRDGVGEVTSKAPHGVAPAAGVH
jgi:hypothetical protein